MRYRLTAPSLIFFVALMSCLAACGAGSSTTLAGAQPTATAINPPPPTIPATSASGQCADLSPMTRVLQAKQGHVGFSMSVTPNLVIKGAITSYSVNGTPSVTGSGYDVGPNNDPIQIQASQGTKFDMIVIDDMTQGKTTTYTALNCTFKSSNDILFTGSDPAAFTLDFLLTP